MAKYGLKTVASTEFYVDSGAGGARHRGTRRIITRRKIIKNKSRKAILRLRPKGLVA